MKLPELKGENALLHQTLFGQTFCTIFFYFLVLVKEFNVGLRKHFHAVGGLELLRR